MSEENILNEYIKLINKGYCSDCNELNCIDNFPHKKIVKAIEQLQQENKELSKEILNKTTINITLKKDRDYWQCIVKELEKWLKERLSTKPLLTTYSFEIDGKQTFVTEIEEKELSVVLDKLKELKEGKENGFMDKKSR